MNSAQMKGNWQRLVGKGKEYAAGVRQRATAALRVGDRTCSPPLCAGWAPSGHVQGGGAEAERRSAVRPEASLKNRPAGP